MKPLVLIDLDDTLLENNIDTFLPVYIRELSNKLSDFPAKKVSQELLAATQAMVQNSSPALTLEKVFDLRFYPSLGTQKELLGTEITEFYANEFARVQPVTSKIPEAIALVKSLLDAGYPIVLATNPIFPRQAVIERLKWAGLLDNVEDFETITSYEYFHFSKPNPAYFVEILAQLEWKYPSAVMIGNDWEQDIQAASRSGLAAYWLTDDPGDLPPEASTLCAQGDYSGILPWLEKISEQNYSCKFDSISSIHALLKSTPAALDSLCNQLSDEEWLHKPAPDEWSVTEILCHLRDVDKDVNLPRIEMLLKNDNYFITGEATDQWAAERDYFHQDGKKALAEFIEVRSKIIKRLSEILPEEWNIKARHAIFGPTTLKELISFTLTHDRVHLQQIGKTKIDNIF